MEKLNIDEMFRCFKCDYMVDEPHESECCGKLHCQSCVVELTFNQCKICKKSVKFRKNLFAKKLLQKVELKCRHHCGGKFLYDDMKIHLYRCERRIFKCTIEFCTFVGRKFELIPHMIENHEFHFMTILENYEEFKETIDNILRNPIDNRPPAKKEESDDLFPISNHIDLYNYNFPRLRGLLDSDENSVYVNDPHDIYNIENIDDPVDSFRIYRNNYLQGNRNIFNNIRSSLGSLGHNLENNMNIHVTDSMNHNNLNQLNNLTDNEEGSDEIEIENDNDLDNENNNLSWNN